MIDEWPNEQEMAYVCGCGHTMGQHEYGVEPSRCDRCDCSAFHEPHGLPCGISGCESRHVEERADQGAMP